jgi:hypothetical protein
LWKRRATTPQSVAAGTFRVVHPFHPLPGQELELVGYTHAWGEDRVFFRAPIGDQVWTLPASWTDLAPTDPFVAVAAGRSLFRVEDLLRLAHLLGEMTSRGCKRDFAGP